MNDSAFYVTTPIYYVNDKPHIGHAYTTILADVIAQYSRMLNRKTFFLTGTDEHGQKVEEAARALDREPLEHCDITVERFLELWKKLEITNNYFIRTTDEQHVSVVRDILQDLYDRELIYKGTYEGWYCVPCERFFTEKDLVDGACPECERKVKKIEEPNYFYKMGQYQDWLIEYIEEHPGFIQPDFRANEVLGFLRQGPLGDLCISRPKERLSWGIELPFDSGYVCYVWFDALINYISAVGFGKDDETFSIWWPASYHLIGKDILTTHAVYWPIMLKGIGVEMPKTIFAHGWWLTRDSKMSKSKGNIVNPMDMIDTYGVDPFRYFLIAEMKLGKDCNFSEEIFVTRYNAELANNLGNLANRVMTMLAKHCGGKIPSGHTPGPAEQELRDRARETVECVEESIADLGLDRMVVGIVAFMNSVNKYFEDQAPWNLIKENDRQGFERVLYTSAECLRIISGLLRPLMPGKMTDLQNILGLGDGEADIHLLREWNVLKEGTAIGQIVQLFPRVEYVKNGSGDSPEAGSGEEEKMISFDEFKKMELRTVRVKQCEKVDKSDKLLKMTVDTGDGTRTVVAGLAGDYDPEDLEGKDVIIVANLEPATLFGIESQGMLLAADTGKGYALVVPDRESPPGSSVS